MHLSKLKMTKTLKKDEKLSHLSLRVDTLYRDTLRYPSLFIHSIDLFRLFILFPQYKSRDNTQEDWFFVLLVKNSACKHEYVCMRSF